MITKTIHAFTLMGLSVRTSNAREMSGQGQISATWARFFNEGIAKRLDHRLDQNIVAAYTDFESDETGEYTFIVGVAVDNDEALPEGLTACRIPDQTCLQISTERGPLPAVGLQAWTKIWLDRSLAARRAFQTDLEIYGTDAVDPQNGRFDILLSLK